VSQPQAMKETAARGVRRFELPSMQGGPQQQTQRIGGLDMTQLVILVLVGGGALLLIGVGLIILVVMRTR
jgi:hypothetical protein